MFKLSKKTMEVSVRARLLKSRAQKNLNLRLTSDEFNGIPIGNLSATDKYLRPILERQLGEKILPDSIEVTFNEGLLPVRRKDEVIYKQESTYVASDLVSLLTLTQALIPGSSGLHSI